MTFPPETNSTRRVPHVDESMIAAPWTKVKLARRPELSLLAEKFEESGRTLLHRLERYGGDR